jgi:starch phosphorylase
LGFARRFATYKRPNLLLHDPQRLLRLLKNPKFPVQLILSGKAHPADLQGQNLIKEWMQFIKQNGNRPPVIFLADYDMNVSENLVQGVDVWINTPRRPWEASGTSGMKVLVNGGINLSELDGWWAEAYTPKVGWALGDGNEHNDDSVWDAKEAEQLYTILEQEVIPEFYNRNEKGIPVAWVSRMRESMALLTPWFSADRTVREYTELHYLRAAKEYELRSANKGKLGKEITDWKHTLEQNWESIRFGKIKIESTEKLHKFTIQVFFTNIDPYSIQIELFANENKKEIASIKKMTKGEKTDDPSNGYYYTALISAEYPAQNYTARVVPYNPNISIPLEMCKITWQR